jgi:gas vesicle protein
VKGKVFIGAVAVGAVLGSAAAVAIAPCCTSSHSRKKLMRYKNQMFKTVGSVLDAVADFRR